MRLRSRRAPGNVTGRNVINKRVRAKPSRKVFTATHLNALPAYPLLVRDT